MRPARWRVLAAFAFVAGVTQMLWLNFAPLTELVRRRYGVSELAAGTLVLVFPLVYVFLSIPAGALIDRRGYRFSVTIGAVATALFAGLRIYDASFVVLMVAQVGMAVAQPFVINAVSKLVVEWFDESEGAIANGIGTVGMFLGMAVGMAATPALEAKLGLRITMAIFFAIAILATVVFLLAPHDRETPAPTQTGFLSLLRDRQLLAFFAIAFLGLGAFNGLTTWLEQILAPHGIDAETAGLVGGALIVGGIVGAVVIPLLSDALGRRRPFLFWCALVAAAFTVALCSTGNVVLLYVYGAIVGFFFLPAFALVLDMSAQVAGVERAGATTSLLMLAGNGGGVVIIVAVPILRARNADLAVALLAGLLVVAASCVAFIRADRTATS